MSSPHSPQLPSAESARVPAGHAFSRWPLPALVVGLGALMLVAAGKHTLPFFLSFHLSWLFYLSLGMGAVFFVLIQFATKAQWSVVVRRLAEHVGASLPLFLLLYAVMVWGGPFIYSSWMSPEAQADPAIAAKGWYLSPLPFYIRGLVYLVLFTLVGRIFARYSLKQDKTADPYITLRLQNLSYPALAVLGFAVTFAAFDWIMSLSPLWYSTIFGIYFFTGCYVSFLAALIVLTKVLQGAPLLRSVISVEHFHDLGKLLFGHTCFWAYAAFAQYLLIWYGNLPEETIWYAVRQHEGWFGIWTLLCLGHFVLPFVLLVGRKAKRSPRFLTIMAVWILAMHYVDLYWLVYPSLFPEGPVWGINEALWLVGIGGLFVAFIALRIKNSPAIPLGDPRLKHSLDYHNV